MSPTLHELPATPATIHWGYFDPRLQPALVVSSGDLVRIEAITHHAGDAPDLLMDAAIEHLFDAVSDRGPGPHVLTGPIAVAEAKPGDVLQVDILAVEMRLPFGSNLAAPWGLLHGDFAKERVTIYELDAAAMRGRALFAFDRNDELRPGTVIVPGSRPRERALEGVVVPLRPHFGTIGLAPAQPGRHSSVPPGVHGGNIDNWRIGAGARMLYPVQVPGALASFGDPHVSQGDGEISGTALEASVDALVRLTVRTDLRVATPILDTGRELFIHGFGDDLDEAMRDCARRTLEVLCESFGLSRDDAYSFMSVAADFVVTQVVDGRQGVHGRIDKACFPFAGPPAAIQYTAAR